MEKFEKWKSSQNEDFENGRIYAIEDLKKTKVNIYEN